MSNLTVRQMFRVLNKYFMVPVFRLGLGSLIVNPFTGYIMVIKTVGRKSGQVRYAPVNYALLDGYVYCLAGYGRGADWYLNVLAQPTVELLMPGGVIRGLAEPVTEHHERLRSLRQILKNGGFAGFLFGFNPYTAPDEMLLLKCQNAPLLRIRPAGVRSGPSDPGGWQWVLWLGLGFIPLALRWLGLGNKRRLK